MPGRNWARASGAYDNTADANSTQIGELDIVVLSERRQPAWAAPRVRAAQQ